MSNNCVPIVPSLIKLQACELRGVYAVKEGVLELVYGHPSSQKEITLDQIKASYLFKADK